MTPHKRKAWQGWENPAMRKLLWPLMVLAVAGIVVLVLYVFLSGTTSLLYWAEME